MCLVFSILPNIHISPDIVLIIIGTSEDIKKLQVAERHLLSSNIINAKETRTDVLEKGGSAITQTMAENQINPQGQASRV